MNHYYPCFLQTYNALYYLGSRFYNSLSDKDEIAQFNRSTLSQNFQNHMDIFPKKSLREMLSSRMIQIACKHSKYVCILTQHFKDVVSLHDYFVQNKATREFFTNEMVQLLYQVYAPLADMMDSFTHYDLHTNNVLLYKIPNGGYVTMNYYKSDGTVISFKTKFIAKIIDYGRSYWHGLSPKMHVKVCDEPECKNTCGDERGFSYLQTKLTADDHYIASATANISHDLRLFQILANTPGKFSSPGNKIAYELRKMMFHDLVYEEDYGTSPRDTERGSDQILNVSDLSSRFEFIIRDMSEFKDFNDEIHAHDNNVGTLNIYLGRVQPMQYMPN